MADPLLKKYIRRQGSTNQGREFENLIVAKLALDFTLDQNILNFNIKSNVDNYGALDDVIVAVEENGIKQQYCIQLKYKESSKKTLPKEALNADRGDYSLKKYCEDYHRIIEKNDVSCMGVLMAKANFTADENELLTNGMCGYRIKKRTFCDQTSRLCKSLDNHCICYSFIIEENDNTYDPKEVEHYKKFFQNFVLCVSTTSIFGIGKSISKTFELNFFERSGSSDFLDIVKSLTKECYSLEKTLTKHVVTLCLLDRHMSSLVFETNLTETKKLLIQAVLENDITHLTSVSNFDDFGKDFKSQVTNEEVEKLSNLFKFDENSNNQKYNKALWLQGKCPLVVNSHQTSRAAIKLSLDLKYILIDENPIDVKNVANFKTLEDLKQKNLLVYNNIVDTFKCTLQNKTVNVKTLVNLDPKMLQIITANELFTMACNNLVIARVTLDLPVPHIFPRHFKDNKNREVSEIDIVRNESKNCVIFAGPGMGKTTICKNLLCTSNPNLFTIFLNARDLSDFLSQKKDNLEEFKKFLLKKQENHLNQLEYNVFKIFLDNNALRLVWDALDEIDKSNFKNIKSLIMQLQNEKTIHYITMRPHLENDLKKNFHVQNCRYLTLVEFDEIEQQYYVQQKLDLNKEDLKKTYNAIKINIRLSYRENVLGIPFQIFMITELLKQEQVTGDDIYHQDFSIERLYEYFVNEKLRVYFVDKLNFSSNIKGVKKIIDEKIVEYTTLFKQLSVQLYFDKKHLKLVNVECDSKILQDINANGDDTGFIITLNKISDHYAKVQFFHNSMSEYFAALFLSENLKIIKKIENFYADRKYNNIRFFFDLILARDCKAHIAVLYKNWWLLDQCTEEEMKKTDKGGRNALQILILTNETKNFKIRYFTKNETIILKDNFFQIPHFRKKDTVTMIEKIKILSREVDIFAKDIVLDFNIFDYLKETGYFLIMAILHKELKAFAKKLLKKYKKDIIVSCLFYDYCDILNFLEELPQIVIYWKSNSHLESTLLYYKCSNWIKKLTLDKSLKCNVNFNVDRLTLDWSLIYENFFLCGQPNAEYTLASNINEIIKLIITVERTYVINDKNKSGMTMLLRASQLVLPETVNLLLKNGADISISDNDGNTCLHYACDCINAQLFKSLMFYKCSCRHNRILIIKSLIEKGAKVNARNKNNQTPLHRNCANLNIIKLLIENNADINAADNNKRTVLHYACQNKSTTVQMIEFLLANNASVNCQDVDNYTPLDYADASFKQELVDSLFRKKTIPNPGTLLLDLESH